MAKIGITERGDAGLHLDWAARLNEVDYAILVTKSLNDRFITAVAKRPEKIVVHVTCTGWGGTALEPRVRPMAWTRRQYDRLVGVLPPEQTVLRIDPVIPNDTGLAVAGDVLDAFADSAIKRVRFSLLDMYPHAGDRFRAAGMLSPYGGAFQPTAAQRRAATDLFASRAGRYDLESCAEPGPWQIGCISERDSAACGQSGLALGGTSGQRAGCLCPGAKTELLNRGARPCGHGCLYCYWKGDAPAKEAGPESDQGELFL